MRYPLAPMNGLMWGLTVMCLVIPWIILAAAFAAPPPVRIVLYATAGFIGALYAVVWLWLRPREFILDDDGLEIGWPVRRRRIAGATIVDATVLDLAGIKRELGYLLRIGAGGLWGGFGLARTRQGTLELWISRTDQIVWVRCVGRRSLLITPAEPERFVAQIKSRASTATSR